METITQIISKEQLLNHWIGHRALTKRIIEKFPEEDFFEFSIGGMRTFSEIISELLAMEAPGLKAITERSPAPFCQEGCVFNTKAEYLTAWDKATEAIDYYWGALKEEDFNETFKLFGQYEFPVYQNIFYFIDNEIHHRGQGFVYLRALGIEPPFFWERY